MVVDLVLRTELETVQRPTLCAKPRLPGLGFAVQQHVPVGRLQMRPDPRRPISSGGKGDCGLCHRLTERQPWGCSGAACGLLCKLSRYRAPQSCKRAPPAWTAGSCQRTRLLPVRVPGASGQRQAESHTCVHRARRAAEQVITGHPAASCPTWLSCVVEDVLTREPQLRGGGFSRPVL